MTPNEKDPVEDCVNLSSPIQMQLSLEPTICSDFLFHFRNLHQILNILKIKMIVIATLFRKLQTVKDLVRPLFKKHHFRNSFDNQHVKGSQSLVKSAWEHFHHIFSSLWNTLIFKKFPLVISYILGVFRSTLTASD